MLTATEIQILLTSGGTVVTIDGDKVGTVTQVFVDDQSGHPTWVAVTTGLFGRAETYVPLAQASVRGEKLVVPYDKSTVDGAPRVNDVLGDLSVSQEAELRRHYGLD